MAKLLRYFQKLFADTAGTNELSKYGSLIGDPPGQLYSGATIDPDIVQELSEFSAGQYAAMAGAYSPTIQDHNSLFWLAFRQIVYNFQMGIAEWNEDTTYFIGSFVNDAGILYVSIQDDNINHVVTDEDWWQTQANIVPTVQIFLSGSGTYTLPTSPRSPIYIRLKLCGGGGGGAGGGLLDGGDGSDGQDTVFGSIATAIKGTGAIAPNGLITPRPGDGGGVTFTIGSGFSMSGQDGQNALRADLPATAATTFVPLVGAAGGQNPFAGAGGGGGSSESSLQNGQHAISNSGCGGGGGSVVAVDPTNDNTPGCGGGAGGYLDIIIPSPDSSYSYSIGAGGAGGSAGSSDAGTGGNGAAGIIIVEEYYQ